MKRYICPVCEHELTAKSYCPECRKIVRQPWVYEGFLPNEYRGDHLRHHEGQHPDRACIEPNRSRVCETPQETRHSQQFTNAQSSQTVYKRYEGNRTNGPEKGKDPFEQWEEIKEQHRAANRGTTATGNQSTAPGSQIWRSTGSGSSTYSDKTYSSNTSNSRKKNKNTGCGCGCLIIVIAIISMIISAISSLEVNLDDWFEMIADESMFVDWNDDEYWDSDWEEIDYNDIMSAGVRCDGYWHYPIAGKTLYDELEVIAEKEIGLSMTETSEYMDNGIYHDSEYGDIRYYDNYRYWDWEDGYFGVVCDTVTDEVHYISVYGYEPKEVIELGMEALEQVESSDVSSIRDLLNQAVESEDLADGMFFDIGNSSIWFYQDSVDKAYCLEVSPVSE